MAASGRRVIKKLKVLQAESKESEAASTARSRDSVAAEDSEVGKVIVGSLAAAVGKLLGRSDADSLLSASQVLAGVERAQSRTKEESLLRAVQHVRDQSLQQSMKEAEGHLLMQTMKDALPAMQQSMAAVSIATPKTIGSQRGRSTADGNDYLTLAQAALQLIKVHCTLACVFGVPAPLVAEEISLEMVRCLKQVVRGVVVPTLSPQKDRAKAAEASADAAAAWRPPEDAAMRLIGEVAETLHSIHEFLCRQGLADELVHQLIHMCLNLFFLAEPHFQLCSSAEEVLVTIFCRHDRFRSSILQEFLVHTPKIPTGKRGRRFMLPVAEESIESGLSTWTHLLLRLIQSSCLPLHEVLGKQVDFEAVRSVRAMAQAYITQLAGGLLQRLLVTRTRDEELRAILDQMLDELLQVAFKPSWPAALALARTLAQQLVGLTRAEKRKDCVDASIREAAVKVVSKVAACLYYHQVDTSKRLIKLPSWSEKQDKVDRSGRMLQHIALRSSLEGTCEMPWTAAAKAVQAWHADLHLSDAEEANSGLRALTDEIVFKQVVLAYLEDERVGPAKFPPGSNGSSTLSAAIFSAGHAIHASTFLICDWADALSRSQKARPSQAKRPKPRAQEGGLSEHEEGGEEDEDLLDEGAREDDEIEVKVEEDEPVTAEDAKQRSSKQAVTKHFLSAAWTSQGPLRCEGTSWRTGAGHRVLQACQVYMVYRQLRCMELLGLRNAMLDCFVVQANSPQASLRRTSMRSLSDVVDADASLLNVQAVEETIEMRLRDESSWVRQVSLDLLGRLLEESLTGQVKDGSGGPAAHSTSAKAVLLRYRDTVRGRINDTSVLVRRQASKILSAFVLAHPTHPDVVPVSLDLLRRSTDSEILRNLVMGTFELLWFMDEEPTQTAVRQLSQVVAASRTLGLGPSNILGELLERFQKNLALRKRAKGFEEAVRRWTTLLLSELVRLVPVKDSPDAQEVQAQRRAVLTAVEAFAVCHPQEMLQHLRPLSVYLCIPEAASSDEQAVASKVCQILAAVLPCAADRRGLVDHRQVQSDLQVLIKNQASSGVRESMRCLCNVVLYVSGDLSQLVAHLNAALPAVTDLCSRAEKQGAVILQGRIPQMFISRQLWTVASLLESIDIDLYIDVDSADSDAAANPHQRVPRKALKFELVGGSVAATMADLLTRLYKLSDAWLRGVLITCLAFFLRGHRHYIKERQLSDMIADALASKDASLRLKALETLSSLLAHFGHAADAESGNSSRKFTDSRDDAAAAAGGSSDAAGAAGSAGQSQARASAIESAQPLAAYTDAVLGHVGIGTNAGLGQGSVDGDRLCAEALLVLRSLHQQGLVNPMSVLPKVFSLCFARTTTLSVPAGAMMKEMLEFRPTLLLNRLDEAFREAFLAICHSCDMAADTVPFTDSQLGALGEVYAERFRKQKSSREAFLRKTLREIFRLDASRFKERFGSCIEAAAAGEPAVNGRLPALHRLRVHFAQFMACVVSSLPFTHESEPLLIVFECNRHLSLHAGALGSFTDATAAPAIAPADGEGDEEGDVRAGDIFGEALGILTSLLLKNTMRIEYSLTAEQCAQFNPKDVRQDRLKFNFGASKGGTAQGNQEGDEMTVCARMRFPLDDWKRLLEPFLQAWDRSDEVVEYAKRVAEGDPWDASYSRHVAALDKLEGRGTKRTKPAAGVAPAEPASKRGQAKAKTTPKSKAKAKAAGKASAKAKSRGRKRKQVDIDSDDIEADPDYSDNDVD